MIGEGSRRARRREFERQGAGDRQPRNEPRAGPRLCGRRPHIGPQALLSSQTVREILERNREAAAGPLLNLDRRRDGSNADYLLRTVNLTRLPRSL